MTYTTTNPAQGDNITDLWGKLLQAFTSTPVVLPPVNTSLPMIDNTSPQVGDTLTVTDGVWTGSPTGYTYQWQFGGVDIPSENSNSYVTQSAYAGNPIRCIVTATNSSGSTPVASDFTNTIPPYAVVPPFLVDNGFGGGSVSSPAIGDTLNADGTWIGASTLNFQWFQNDTTPIGGSISPAYGIGIGDIGNTLRCEVTAIATGVQTVLNTDTSGTVLTP